MALNTVDDIDPDRVKWKMLVPGHYTAKLGCHIDDYRGDDMDGHVFHTPVKSCLSVYFLIWQWNAKILASHTIWSILNDNTVHAYFLFKCMHTETIKEAKTTLESQSQIPNQEVSLASPYCKVSGITTFHPWRFFL